MGTWSSFCPEPFPDALRSFLSSGPIRLDVTHDNSLWFIAVAGSGIVFNVMGVFAFLGTGHAHSHGGGGGGHGHGHGNAKKTSKKKKQTKAQGRWDELTEEDGLMSVNTERPDSQTPSDYGTNDHGNGHGHAHQGAHGHAHESSHDSGSHGHSHDGDAHGHGHDSSHDDDDVESGHGHAHHHVGTVSARGGKKGVRGVM